MSQDKARDALQKEWHSTRRLADGWLGKRSPSDGEPLNRSPTVRRHRFSEAEILDGLSLDLLELALEVALAAAGVPVIGRGQLLSFSFQDRRVSQSVGRSVEEATGRERKKSPHLDSLGGLLRLEGSRVHRGARSGV